LKKRDGSFFKFKMEASDFLSTLIASTILHVTSEKAVIITSERRQILCSKMEFVEYESMDILGFQLTKQVIDSLLTD
jgi:hypothetical protein